MPDEGSPEITKQAYGTMPDGTAIDKFTMKNSAGSIVEVITYGGIITSIQVPDREGHLGDVVLGYDNLEGYLDDSPYFGAIIGRYGNRIAQGKFSIDGTEYSLATNNLGNHLHGGLVGFDKVVWQAEPLTADNSVSLKLTYKSLHMEGGYPGNLDVSVMYTLDDDDQLIIEYTAITDAPTVVNLTNHSYFNMSAGASDILDDLLVINGSKYLEIDSTLIPTAIAPVEGTPFDFTSPKAIGADMRSGHKQLTNGNGYDHCWVIDSTSDAVGFAASLLDPGTGRLLEIYTTEPGIQFYGGNWLDGITGKAGVEYRDHLALCLETQHFPDSPNQPQFPSTLLKPGETYSSRTILRFSSR